MQLHLVGGFLGSGKTTAIIQAAKKLTANGQRVGVVTNDQGRYLVDTAFVRMAELPTVEVTGGCFCCRYDELDKSIVRLIDSASPDVIFAESVGSCADLVATVLKPLMQLEAARLGPSSFSVFTDCRLLRRRLRGDPMPFSEDVVYIFDKQIEEAGLLIVNKVDLLRSDQAEDLRERMRSRLAGKKIIEQNSLSADGVEGWLSAITNGLALEFLPGASLQIDYERYGHGEAQLAWLDEEVVLRGTDLGGALRKLINTLVERLRESGRSVGHIKFGIRSDHGFEKVSLISLEDGSWQNIISSVSGSEVGLIVNARVEMAAGDLREIFSACLQACGIQFSEAGISYFHPAQPNPTHRIA